MQEYITYQVTKRRKKTARCPNCRHVLKVDISNEELGGRDLGSESEDVESNEVIEVGNGSAPSAAPISASEDMDESAIEMTSMHPFQPLE